MTPYPNSHSRSSTPLSTLQSRCSPSSNHVQSRPPKSPTLTSPQNGPLRLTDAELSAYDGTDPSKPVYLALNGTIYDVTAGRHFYGPDGSYSFFAGRDATRAFITGCFDEDLTPDLRGVELAFVPREATGGEVEGGTGKEKVSAEEKTRREREWRAARKRVVDTVEGWATMFRGEGGKDYFRVGEVVREEGWLEKLPVRELCGRAQKTRPKRKD